MNRIILIGNGFDLAHGLKTSYANFIDWYWNEWGKRLVNSLNYIEEDGLCEFSLIYNVERSWSGIVWNCKSEGCLPALQPFDGRVLVNYIKSHPQMCTFSYKSHLLEELCKQLEERRWVDIENVFFKHLSNGFEEPEKVNAELEIIRQRLIDYLVEVMKASSDVEVKNGLRMKMLAPFDKMDIAIGSLEKWREMLEQRVKYYKKEVWHELIPLFFDGAKSWIQISNVDNFLYNHADEIKKMA